MSRKPPASYHERISAIIARAESFTVEGSCPSAQLIAVDALAFDDAVVGHAFTPVAIGVSSLC